MSIWRHFIMVLCMGLLSCIFIGCGENGDDAPTCELGGDVECCANEDCTFPEVCNLSNNTCDFSCGEGETNCGDEDCVFLMTDADNCGSCGNICPVGQSCSNGACSCDDTVLSLCDSACLNLMTDDDNCGACDNPCGDNEICQDGSCTCDMYFTDCYGVCVNTNTDEANCSDCGITCGVDETCYEGVCDRCPGVEEFCPVLGECIDLTTDNANCGTCGFACHANSTCQGGTCTCDEGFDDCSGACVDLNADTANCGECGTSCTGSEVCSIGQCLLECSSNAECGSNFCVQRGLFDHDVWTASPGAYDFGNDPCTTPGTLYCGDPLECNGTDLSITGDDCNSSDVDICTAISTGVHIELISDISCSDGNLSICDGACVDLNADTANCGECGNPCAGGEVCSIGMCLTPCTANGDCAPNFCVQRGLFDHDVWTASPGDYDFGTTPCATPGPLYCGDPLGCNGTDLSITGDDCNSSADICAAIGTEVHIQLISGISCSDGNLSICDGACVDLDNDDANCGECGEPCAGGLTCSAGVCT